MEKIARYAFIAFVIIAIIMGLVVGYLSRIDDPNYSTVNGWVTLILLILGIIVGLTSITIKEIQPFLLATVALIVASIANVWSSLSVIEPLLYHWATAILDYIIAFAAPAAVLIAIKAIFVMAKEK